MMRELLAAAASAAMVVGSLVLAPVAQADTSCFGYQPWGELGLWGKLQPNTRSPVSGVRHLSLQTVAVGRPGEWANPGPSAYLSHSIVSCGMNHVAIRGGVSFR
jgi:hypothetical protein